MKCTFWNFDLSRSKHEASLFRTLEPHIVKSTDRNLFRNPGCLKTVLYSKLQSLLIENIIMLTLVENWRRVASREICNSVNAATSIYLQCQRQGCLQALTPTFPVTEGIILSRTLATGYICGSLGFPRELQKL